MIEIDLRGFANLDEPEVLGWLNKPYKVLVTDDYGEQLETNTYEMMMSWYGLCIHRAFNDFKYSINELVHCENYNDEDFQRPINYFTEILSNVVEDPVQIDLIKQLIHAWQTKLNNFLVIFSERGPVSASAIDVVQILDHPKMQKIKQDYYSGKITINDAEAAFKDLVLNEPSLTGYIFITEARTGGVSINMGFQLFITLGKRFDINNHILPNEINPSYADGISRIADLLAENRSGGSSLNNNSKALKDAEWFHRKIHLFTNVIHGIKYLTDCGSEITVPILISSKSLARSLIGKYAVDDEGKLYYINREKIKKMEVGETVNIRSINYCRNTDTGKPCAVCYGKMYASVPYNVLMERSANPGMLSGTELGERIGQGILSTKHYMRHTEAKAFVVGFGDEKFITTDGDNIYLTPFMKDLNCRLIFQPNMIKELSDLGNLENLDDVNEDLLSTFTKATFKFEIQDPMVPTAQSEQTIHISTFVSSRRARMSKELIEYVIANGWGTNKKELVISLSKFDIKNPLFFLPYVHEDLNQYRKDIENFVSLTERNKVWKDREVTPEIIGETIVDLFKLINRKYEGLNFVHIETFIRCITALDPSNNRYELPMYDQPRYFVSYKHLIPRRGMGSAIIYQGQENIFGSYESFDIKNRQSTSLECFLTNNL